MAGYVDVRAYAVLNDFVAPESPGVTGRRPFRSHQHQGRPPPGERGCGGFSHRPTVGDRIPAYPNVRALDIGSTARLRPVPLRHPRFVVDVNLGRLARLLRVGRGRRVTPTTRPLPMSACHGRTQLPAPQAPAAPPARRPPLGPIDMHRGPHLGNYLTATLEATRPAC